MTLLAVTLTVISTIFGAVGILFVKKATEHKFPKAFFHRMFFFGVIMYTVATVLYLIALKHGSLTVLYPLASLAYVWSILISAKFLGEKITSTKIISICGIILGLVLISLGS